MDTDITLAVVKVYGLIIANKAADSNTTSLVVMAVKGKKTESARCEWAIQRPLSRLMTSRLRLFSTSTTVLG